MPSAKLKYFLDSLPRPPSKANLSPVIIDQVTLQDLVDEVWLTGNKDDAGCILETYAGILTEYQGQTLVEVIFGIEIAEEKLIPKSDNAIKIHKLLDRILF